MTNKIIVGVHGIGDQLRYETIQSIAYQFCRYYKISTAVPLGNFHKSHMDEDGIIRRDSASGKLYFTEAYWADIARQPEEEGYTLEETKQWARAIVERLRIEADKNKARFSSGGAAEKEGPIRGLISGVEEKMKDRFHLDTGRIYVPDDGEHSTIKLNYKMIKSVLYEAIDTIDVLERLLMITGKAGIFDFNLNRVLTNFLGDVQIVTEFEKYRTDIIGKLLTTVDKAYQMDREAHIYIIAHSEGTVVSFLALLEAMKEGPDKHPWLEKVKGFMTLGSPIDKHLTLWPHLWTRYEGITSPGPEKGQIRWRNYFDRGDPVGYELDQARRWVEDNCRAFDFQEEKDFGFSRYYLPGKAHIDYWRDDQVFDNFIDGVVESRSEVKPRGRSWAAIACTVLPYLGLSALLMLSVYFLYKPISLTINPDSAEPLALLLRKVGGISSVIAGITVMARIPRLTRKPAWHMASIFIFGALAAASYFMLGPDLRRTINGSFGGINYLIVAAILSTAVSITSGLSPSARTKPLIFLGGITVLWSACQIVLANSGNSSLWPIFLGGALFIYGWWLSILLFDLIFLWHWYIRGSKAVIRLREMQGYVRGS